MNKKFDKRFCLIITFSAGYFIVSYPSVLLALARNLESINVGADSNVGRVSISVDGSSDSMVSIASNRGGSNNVRASNGHNNIVGRNTFVGQRSGNCSSVVSSIRS